MSIPSTFKAVVTTSDHWIKVAQVNKPSLQSGQVLIKVQSAGINPTDWKHAKLLSPENRWAGCDYSGDVVDAGDSKDVKVGDRLAGFLHGSTREDAGAFAEYTIVEPSISVKLPENVTHDQGATLGVPLFTAAQGLYLRLGLPEPGLQIERSFPVLVWSGATAVGQYVIQLAKLSGLSVVTTASKDQHEYLKSIGADSVFDYKEPDIVAKIREATHNDLAYGFDCISSEATIKTATDCFGQKGGKLVHLGVVEGKEVREDIQLVYTLLYTALGREFEIRGRHFPASPEDRKFHERWTSVARDLLAANKITTLKTEVRGGLDSASAAYQDIIDGKNRGVKYVIHPTVA